jgi:hypothetical protein
MGLKATWEQMSFCGEEFSTGARAFSVLAPVVIIALASGLAFLIGLGQLSCGFDQFETVIAFTFIAWGATEVRGACQSIADPLQSAFALVTPLRTSPGIPIGIKLRISGWFGQVFKIWHAHLGAK